MTEDNDKVQVLETNMEELRRLYDRLTSLYDNIKIKVLALIAGELAIVPFIFSENARLMPSELYGIIFSSIGIACIALSFGLLLWAISTADWLVPLDLKESHKLHERYKNKQEYLEYLKSDYEECIVHCLKKIKTRAKIFNVTLMLFSAGAFIIFVLKYMHGGIQ